MTSTRSILVYSDWVGMKEPLLMGRLQSERVRGNEVFSFSYEKSWLKSPFAQILDPSLQLYEGPQFLAGKQQNFGIFLDSSPDRWGRILMRRREAALARLEKRTERRLFETDYLLGVYDAFRMGGLRFKEKEEGPFLNDNNNMSAPPWTTLRELERISLKLEQDDVIDDPEYLQWLNMLADPGASLGGARPKAGIVDQNGLLWIAKFPSRTDQGDVGGWEAVAYRLAINSGITMATSKVQKFTSNHHTFLTKRFDRNEVGNRIHFASAMTLLQYQDGDDYQSGASYLELAELITTQGGNIDEDLKELWRRIVFNICVSNTDDHLRNHGFLLFKDGWHLSPAYDVNPIETGAGLKLNISENDNALDLELALSVRDYFRLEEKEALSIIKKVTNAVKEWRVIADHFGIPRNEQELKAMAFSKGDFNNP